MKLGFSTLGCPAWTLEHVVKAAKEYGFDGIELRLIDDQVISPDLVVSSLDRIKHAFAGSGIELAALGSSARFSSPDEAERRQNEAVTVEFIRLARELGAPVIRVFGGQRKEGVSMEQAIDNVADSLARLAPIAEDAGVALALETHDDFSRSSDVASVLDRVSSPAIGALWDVHPPYELGESVRQVWDLIGPRVKHTHVKDARPGQRKEWDLVLLGEGEVPAREMVEVLSEHGYRGYLAIEWEKKWRPEIPDPEIAFPWHYQKLREYLSGM